MPNKAEATPQKRGLFCGLKRTTERTSCCPTLRISRGALGAPSAACACSAGYRQGLANTLSGSHFHGRIEVDLPRRAARHYSALTRARRADTVSGGQGAWGEQILGGGAELRVRTFRQRDLGPVCA